MKIAIELKKIEPMNDAERAAYRAAHPAEAAEIDKTLLNIATDLYAQAITDRMGQTEAIDFALSFIRLDRKAFTDYLEANGC